ncbi:MAG: MFS transporter [Candidatus Levybacteria bacterium]|nr:MFS transporter [Candidatus Levybacteria bacterium]
MQKKIFWLYITVFVNITGFGMVFPLLPLFAETFKATPFDIGILAASFSVGQFVAAPIFGRLSDKYGRKPILAASIIGSALAFFLIGFANNLTLIFLSRVLHGVATAGNFPIAQAYIADIVSKEKRTEYMGKVAALFALGFVFGPAIGGFLGSLGFSLAFIAAALITLVNLVLVWIFLPESLTKKAKHFVLREGFLNLKAIYSGLRGDFGVLFYLLFAWSFYISNFQVAIPLLTEAKFAMKQMDIGIFFSMTGLASAIAQWFLLPIVIRKIGELKTILLGIGLMVFGQLLAPLTLSLTLFYVFFIFSIIGSGFKRPTVNAVLSKATKEGQGTTMGLAFSFESMGRIFGPVIAGFTIGRLGYSFPFWVTVVVLLVGFILFYRVEMRRIR